MIEEKITTRDKRTIVLKYDKENYSIEYVKNKNIIILRRLLDNQILEIFSDRIGFIVQCNIGEQVNFIVTNYSTDMREKNKLNHYTDRWYLDSLQLEKSFDCDTCGISNVRITDSSYLINQQGHTGCLYNLSQISRRFKRVYNDEKVNKYFKDNTLLVSERFGGLDDDIKDTLTYGINPETFEITTPIWSELQQRSINVYTEEQADKIRDEFAKKGITINIKDLGEFTIYFEVRKYLIEIGKYFDRSKRVYNDVFGHDVNEEFVRKFVK